MNSNKILVTGTAGFIGFHLTGRLIKDGYDVVGLDVINDYYDIHLKYARLREHGIERTAIVGNQKIASVKFDNYHFYQMDLADYDTIVEMMQQEKFTYVVNLAAQAGVRYSIDNPRAYTHSNIDGFLSILEGCRYSGVEHLIFASTSSVYGLNKEMPLSEEQKTDKPMALYAATKKANELMAHSYAHLFNLPCTGLRFFTVYGPWGRPDMALFLFADAILKDQPINVFNHGKMIRDFTYVGDIVESISRLIPKPALPDNDQVPFKVFNIGNSSPVKLMEYIEALEKALGKTAQKNFMDIQAGDVPATHADVSRLENYVNFRPQTSVEDGVSKFVQWYLTTKS
jgi:UDP-glucuronate 4-epimerase